MGKNREVYQLLIATYKERIFPQARRKMFSKKSYRFLKTMEINFLYAISHFLLIVFTYTTQTTKWVYFIQNFSDGK